jgi:hypothetical protein
VRTSFRPVLAATVFLSLFGYVWYGILFQSLQMQAHGYTPSDYAGNSPLWYTGGVLISLVIALGLQHMLRLSKRTGFRASAWVGLQAALAFGAPLVTYPFVFAPNHDLGLYAVGLGHILLAWPLAASLMGAISPTV